jgi:hypothetical protein
MYPDDRVLVGVINRKRDFDMLRAERWYRIPQEQMPRGIHTEYVAFFLSGKPFKERAGGVHYFARFRGLELLYRRDLLPKEANHAHANNIYYKVAVAELTEKIPPILNTTKRTITFIYTTWDRFVFAQTIPDLYSKADFFVDRIYHALDSRGVRPSRTWEAEHKNDPFAPAIRVICQHGEVVASPQGGNGVYKLDAEQSQDKILQEILDLIAQSGGPVLLRL